MSSTNSGRRLVRASLLDPGFPWICLREGLVYRTVDIPHSIPCELDIAVTKGAGLSSSMMRLATLVGRRLVRASMLNFQVSETRLCNKSIARLVELAS